MPTTIRPGDTLDDRYRLDDLLSESGSGRFWRAHDRVLQRHVALHVVASDDERTPALLDAARRSATVINPRILRVLDAQMRTDVAFVVNEFAYGTSLDIALANNGPMVPRRAAWLVGEVADSVAAAHAHGVHHGRLVPENILIDQTGNIRIIGFAVDAALHGLPAGDEASDVRDVAGLLYAALTGRWAGEATSSVPAAPHDGARLLRPRQVRAGVPRPLDDLVDQLLNPDATRLRGRGLEHADAVAAYLADFVGDPSGIAESLAAAHPARAQDLVVLEQVPEIPVRPEPARPDEPSGWYADGRPEPTIQVPRLELDRRLQAAAAALAAGVTAPDGAAPDEPEDREDLEAADAQARAEHLAELEAELAAVVPPDPVDDPDAVLDTEVGIEPDLEPGSLAEPIDDTEPTEDTEPTVGDAGPDEPWTDDEDLLSVLEDEAADDVPPALLLDRDDTPEQAPYDGRRRPAVEAPAPRSRDRARRATRAARSAQTEDPIGSRIDYFTSLYSGDDPLGIGIAQPTEETEQWEDEEWSGGEAEWPAAAISDEDLADQVVQDRADEADEADDVDGFERGDTAERIPAVRPSSRALFAPDPEPGETPRGSRPRPTPTGGDNAPWKREHDIRAQLRDDAEDPDNPEAGPVAGRGWLRVAGLIALAVVLILGVTVAYNRGGGADGADGGAAPVTQPKTVAAGGPVIGGLTATVFDPTGDPEDSSEGVAGAVDADLATSWKTGTFTEQFSPDGARAGLGLLIDTGSEQPISQIDLTLDAEPSHVVLYVLDDVPQSLSTTQSAAEFDATTTQSVSLRAGTTGRYVIVWLTKIPQVGASYEGGVADVTLRS